MEEQSAHGCSNTDNTDTEMVLQRDIVVVRSASYRTRTITVESRIVPSIEQNPR